MYKYGYTKHKSDSDHNWCSDHHWGWARAGAGTGTGTDTDTDTGTVTSQNPVVIRSGLYLNLYFVIKMTRQIQSLVVILSLTCFLYTVLICLQSLFV